MGGVVRYADCAKWRHVIFAVESNRLISMRNAVLLEVAFFIEVIVDIHLLYSYICDFPVYFYPPFVLQVPLVSKIFLCVC